MQRFIDFGATAGGFGGSSQISEADARPLGTEGVESNNIAGYHAYLVKRGSPSTKPSDETESSVARYDSTVSRGTSGGFARSAREREIESDSTHSRFFDAPEPPERVQRFGFGSYRGRYRNPSGRIGTQRGNSTTHECFRCGQQGHRASDCYEPRTPDIPSLSRQGTAKLLSKYRDAPPHGDNRESGYGGFGNGGFGSGGFGSSGFGSGGFGRPVKPCYPKQGYNPPKSRRTDDGITSERPFVPDTVSLDDLFNRLKIEPGIRFKEFFDSEVKMTSKGRNIKVIPYSSFDELGLPKSVMANITRAKYTKPTPVQRYSMAVIAKGHDLMACSQTGSGKTAAFLLPIIKWLIEKHDIAPPGEIAYPRCVILAPTRELADQLFNEVRKFTVKTPLRLERIYGGTQTNYFADKVKVGPTIIVCTLGRLLEFLRLNYVSLDELRFLVIDEADKMLDQRGFHLEVERLLKMAPPKQTRTNLMFSATFPDEVQRVAKLCLRAEHVELAVDKIGSANKCIKQIIVDIPTSKKLVMLRGLLLQDQAMPPEGGGDSIRRTLIFVNTKTMAKKLATLLSDDGFTVGSLHADISQRCRHTTINAFRSGKVPILIATGVAERGLDIRGVDHVVNYELPSGPAVTATATYVQRIGRTGRVGNNGLATSFFDKATDISIVDDLIQVLVEAQQVVPDFLARLKRGVRPFGGFYRSAATEETDEELW